MGGERVEHLSEELEQWVEQKAEESGVDRSEVIRRALTAYRLVDDGEFESRVDELDGRVDELDGRVDELATDLDEKVTDLRERVIQIKREADAKADADHDHPEVAAEAERALAAVDDVSDTVTTLERRMEGGFENYEDVLEYLADAAEDTEEKLDAVAGAVVDLRERSAEAERAAAERSAATELKREANRMGVSSATCEACENGVDVSLLDVPYCPHCGETFDGVREKRRFFGSPTLTTGRRPALAESTDAEAAEPLFDGVDPSDWDPVDVGGLGGDGPTGDPATSDADADVDAETGETGATDEETNDAETGDETGTSGEDAVEDGVNA